MSKVLSALLLISTVVANLPSSFNTTQDVVKKESIKYNYFQQTNKTQEQSSPLHLPWPRGDPFNPCRRGQDPSYNCNTSQFCNAAFKLKQNGCYFMPYFCGITCYKDIAQLNKTDCMQHPSDPWLEQFAEHVHRELATWNKTCRQS